MKLKLQQRFKSLEPFLLDLPDFVILTGVNGAGKTQILNAIFQNILKTYDDDNIKELNPKKYVAPHSLSPNESILVTRDQLNQNTHTILQQFNQYLQNKQNNANFQYTQIFRANSAQKKIIEQIAQNANKKIEELTADDVYLYYPIDDRLQESDVFYQNFSNLFKRYQDKFEENAYRQYRKEVRNETEFTFLTDKEFRTAFGEPPWDFVNKIIKEASLDYHINPPTNLHRDTPFQLKLVNNYSGVEILFGDLSSGEKVLMSLALAIYNSNFDIEFPKILLMDEPDASLHPSMSKKFLDVIQKVFVNEKKVKVIISTHSASTVALAPEDSIFVVNKTGIRIEKAKKDKALKILTSGVPSFSVNYENRRQVFVESAYDVTYYEKLYQQLSNYLIPEISLSFISSGESKTDKNGSKISNCGQVLNIAETLRKAGNKFISGIIDWDSTNKSTEVVKVLGNGNRYSIENYIFDPLLVAVLLLREKIVAKEEIGLGQNETFMDIINFPKDKIQILVDYVIAKVSAVINPTDTKLILCKLVNDIEINIPEWYLHYQGHALEAKLITAFPKLNALKRDKEEALKLEILTKVVDDMPTIISKDILDVLNSVQVTT
ncbi:AAA family ATPase [Leptospira bourretii]|uniref:ATP-binding protein n=1 Tax=Leptospira bourretii TaxID=2484962 RepID=A0ABY2LIA4_9LEPT|nr:AAA family ATPase [Leptospira bourretii]TGK94056.1 ATP-binding protein [Leptospira bourretii]TGL28151.1 ATP-binding protein [Leptospira bourretii]